MSVESNQDKANARQGRFVSLVIAGTMILWMAAQWASSAYNWSPRYIFLIDLFALAGFLWAFIVTLQMWRKRR